MSTNSQNQGTWIHRFAIRLFTVFLGVLVFWLLDFLLDDVRSVRGPEYGDVEQNYVDAALVAQRAELADQIEELTRQIDNQKEKQVVVRDSSQNLRQTITQLLELQKIGLEKNVSFSDTEQANFSNSLNLFLENQTKYQQQSQMISDMLQRKQDMVQQLEQVEHKLEQQRLPAREEFNQLNAKHRLKLAFLQLAILVPILLVAAALIATKRSSIYFPLFLAFGAATLVKVALVMHEYFPSRYFKYVLIVSLLLVVAWLLVYFIRMIAFPKAQWLINQYREAYERFLCPVCDYPIRTGPRRFLYWTRRTVHKLVVPSGKVDQEQIYSCPSCGNQLFEECPLCHKVRHALLPHCLHCGAQKNIAE